MVGEDVGGFFGPAGGVAGAEAGGLHEFADGGGVDVEHVAGEVAQGDDGDDADDDADDDDDESDMDTEGNENNEGG